MTHNAFTKPCLQVDGAVICCCIQDVQQKVRPYLLGTDMSGFKYDDFIRVLDIVNK